MNNMTTGQREKALLSGVPYAEFLGLLHENLRPALYLEIGTLSGATLKLAKCDSIAVDPKFAISSDVIGQKPCLLAFQCPSDHFFQAYDPFGMLRKRIDLAFLDGMHLYEFLLRDLINTERLCRSNSIICLHDCIPPHPRNALRDPADTRRHKTENPDWWTGDVWKLLPILKRWRPDLSIHVLDCPPTGLILVTNLDPNSEVLTSKYSEIIQEFAEVELDDYGFQRFLEACSLKQSKDYVSFESISKYFWL